MSLRKKPYDTVVVINPMTYKRLFSFLRSFLVVPDNKFEPELLGLLKPFLADKREELLEQGKKAKEAFFVSRGLMYATYMDRTKGKVVYAIFKPGEIGLIPDSFMNDLYSDSGLEVIEGSMLLYVTAENMEDLYAAYPATRALATKVVASLWKTVRERDELLQLKGEFRIKRFFEIYPLLLKSGRQALMLYKDMASYLHMTEFNFCILMKKIYPDLR